jgi:hypothetical protein
MSKHYRVGQDFSGVAGMDAEFTGRTGAEARKRLSLRDFAIVALAGALIVLGNVGVVRALDVALDALHR